MKRCPECRRDYADDTLLYCLEDGAALVQGSVPAASGDARIDGEPQTAIFPSRSALESATAAFPAIAPSQGSATNSIAVLPFKNISADPENEYFCEGLAEELLNALTKIAELKVAARTSTFSFKNAGADIAEIARKLGVAHVVEGSVRKSGERLRIAVQLSSASDGYHIWSETFDRTMSDIFDVQDEITLSVVDALKVKLLGSTRSSVLKRETENTEAYKEYLRGRYLRYAKNDHLAATLAYEEAVRLDPQHAPSWVGLAESYALRAHYAVIDPLEAACKSKDCLATANGIQGDSGEALYVAGFAAFIERDWNACDAAYRRSIEMDPNNARSLGTFGVINCVMGRVDEGLRVLERARETDPLAAYPYAMTGCALTAAGRPEEALPFFEQSFAFERNNTLALWAFSIAAASLGKYDEGIDAASRASELSGRHPFFQSLLGWAYSCAGDESEATSILANLEARPKNETVAPGTAALLAALNKKDAALEVFSRAVDQHAPMSYYVKLPCFDSMRDDERFEKIVERLNLPGLRK